MAMVFVSITGPVFGDVKIKYVPMSEQQAALTDGGALYEELCAVCHGDGGLGDGKAVSALKTAPTNLTVLALQNDGTFPRDDVESMISGRFRDESHFSACGMPSWYRAFSGVNPKWKLHRRHAFAMGQIERLTDYLETIQVSHSALSGEKSTVTGASP